MSYISEIFQRVNIQNIREFLLYGSECSEHCPKGYMEQLNEAYEDIHKLLCENSLSMNNEEISNAVMQNVNLIEKVHMEVGLVCGFKLALQMLTGRDMKET